MPGIENKKLKIEKCLESRIGRELCVGWTQEHHRQLYDQLDDLLNGKLMCFEDEKSLR